MSKKNASPHSTKSIYIAVVAAVVIVAALLVYVVLPRFTSVSFVDPQAAANAGLPPPPKLDTVAYDMKLLQLAHIATTSPFYTAFMMGTTTVASSTERHLWPPKTVYPKHGAILPFHRIVAYYGNFYSKQMGILGEYPKEEVLRRLKEEVAHWEAADPTTPVMPAIEYIDVTAQASAGRDGKYRARMPDSQIDKALEYAKEINGIVILDIQVGFSTLPEELPLLKDYFARPDVHLALDPEFSMKGKYPPGREIGTFSSHDINYAISYLSDIVRANDLPPKVLLVHRFTQNMVTGYQNIKPTPEVQVVMVMDGWGFPGKKINTYNVVIGPEPVQFAGIKLFYKNDLKEVPSRLMSDQEVLGLYPTPIYIQYQ